LVAELLVSNQNNLMIVPGTAKGGEFLIIEFFQVDPAYFCAESRTSRDDLG
jgi:hypothetical protein